MNETNAFDALAAPLRATIEARGFTTLTEVQRAVLSSECAGRDLRISSQTGSGKTLALGLRLAEDFLAAAAAKTKRSGPLALLIAPTRELATQVAGELGWLLAKIPGANVEVVTGGSDFQRERHALARRPGMLVGTPGRLLDHLRRGTLSCESTQHVVLDEADQMLDMGFREELEAILEQLPAERHSHLVSATFPAAVKRLADRFQNNALHVQGTRLGAANEDIQHIVHRIRPFDTLNALVNVLLRSRGARTLVFVRRRTDTIELSERLGADGFSVRPFSGELSQSQRTQTLDSFRNGSVDVLISTDVAARGIDIPNIEMVIHADLPTDADSYTHRSGRTGRAGQSGRSILLMPAHAERHLRRVLDSARVEPQLLPVPTGHQIQRALTKHTRRELHTILDSEAGPPEKQLTYAEQLLEGHDPKLVIAALLELAEPKPVRPPAVLDEPHPASSRDRRPPRPRPQGGFQRFEINWGRARGATPPRVLSHVCRRGQLTRDDVGAIRIGPLSTMFEISVDAASAFERLSRRPDARDPELSIRRFAA
ncbi:MAG: DEAD/DEAH box helicase [Deltaproteobacteria bacterium]